MEAQDWSLNPGRYVGSKSPSVDDVEFGARLELLGEKFESLRIESERYADAIRELVLRATS